VSQATNIGVPTRRVRTRRIVVLVLVLGIVGAVVGALVGFRLAGVNTATATVLVNPLDGNPYSTSTSGDDLVNLQTEAQLVSSATVVSSVQQEVGGNLDAATLQSKLSVDVPSNTQIISIAYSSRQGAQATRIAQTFAEKYLDLRRSRATALVQNQVNQLNSQIATLAKSQSSLARQLNRAGASSTQASVLRAQLDGVATQLDQLRANLAQAQSTPLDPGQIITPAALPPAGTVPLWVLTTIGGLLAGVVIGILIGSLPGRRREEDVPPQAQDAGVAA